MRVAKFAVLAFSAISFFAGIGAALAQTIVQRDDWMAIYIGPKKLSTKAPSYQNH